MSDTISECPRVGLLTLGCKVNQCDGEEIARSLARAGFEVVGRGEEAEVYIVNTCAVTATAEAKARKLLRKLAREHPEAAIVVTGCLAQRSPEAMAALPGVSAVVPNPRKRGIADMVAQVRALRSPAGSGRDAAGVGVPALQGRRRAFVKVQDGCDHGCAYCVVPQVRGPMVSRSRPEVLREVARLAAAGAKEAVLCGIRLGAYDDGSLRELLHDLRGVNLPRLRLSSIEPMDLSDALLAEIANHPRLCHHLHLPLQSGDDGVLAEMGRGYTTGEFAGLMARVRAAWPEVAVSTDVMVGFSGETEEQFRRTLGFVRAMQFSRLHVFPFSPRPGTPAAALKDTPAAVKTARREEMLRVAQELAQGYAERWVGSGVEVLCEGRDREARLTGLTEHYVRVRWEGPREQVGEIVRVTAREAKGGELKAEVTGGPDD